MTKYRLIYIAVQNDAESEVVQRLAFTFGYNWPNNTSGVVYRNVSRNWGLSFDPNTKTISTKLGNDKTQTAYSNSDLINLFKNPPKEMEVRTSNDKEVTAEVLTEGVTFYRPATGSRVYVPQDLINKVVGNRALPLVCFHYPESGSCGVSIMREVRVIKFDGEYLCGLEEVRGGVKHSSPLFKKYDATRIKGPTLLEFIQYPKS